MTLPYIKALFNDILSSGTFPSIWCESLITPIHKKGSYSDPNNYRAVSVANSLSKVFMKILSTRLTIWANVNGAIDESQAGFRAGYNTTDNMFNLNAVIQKYTSKRHGRLYVFFIDFFKAFDSCKHQQLWCSLVRKGIKEDSLLLAVLKSMYSQLSSCVKLPDGLTEYFDCNIGTKQGCVSSTIIFALYINDLVTHLKRHCGSGIFISNQVEEIQALMFADDIATVAETAWKLQTQINRIYEFCESTGMQLNLDKSKIMVFRNGGPLRHYESWFYNERPIEVVPFYRYLCSFFTPKLCWTKTKDTLAKQAKKVMGTIFRYQKYFGYFIHTEAFKRFDTVVKPILM